MNPSRISKAVLVGALLASIYFQASGHGEDETVAESTKDAIDALLEEVMPPQSYESARTLPDAVDAKPVRLSLVVYEADHPLALMRDDIASIERAEAEERKPVAPHFGIGAVFTEPQMGIVRKSLEKRLGKALFEETARLVPGGKIVPLFAEGSALKGWEDCFLRVVGDEENRVLDADLAMKSQGAPEGVGMSVSIWTGQWIHLSGPVTKDKQRAVFLRIESTGVPKEE